MKYSLAVAASESQVGEENENLTKLMSLMKDMSASFEVFNNTRIENKRKMEKKF